MDRLSESFGYLSRYSWPYSERQLFERLDIFIPHAIVLYSFRVSDRSKIKHFRQERILEKKKQILASSIYCI
jgi:hypothetical protein